MELERSGLGFQNLSALDFFPPGVALAISDPSDLQPPLFDGEAAFVARAVERRIQDFEAGRACARRALVSLGVQPQALLQGAHGEPIWPPGYVGSVTHCTGFCAAAAAQEGDYLGLGLDAEVDGPLTHEVNRLVCRPEELAQIVNLRESCTVDLCKLIFSAKESVFKCYFPTGGDMLDFQDVSLQLLPADDGRSGVFRATLVNTSRKGVWLNSSMEGRWRHASGRVHTSAYMRARA